MFVIAIKKPNSSDRGFLISSDSFLIPPPSPFYSVPVLVTPDSFCYIDWVVDEERLEMDGRADYLSWEELYLGYGSVGRSHARRLNLLSQESSGD